MVFQGFQRRLNYHRGFLRGLRKFDGCFKKSLGFSVVTWGLRDASRSLTNIHGSFREHHERLTVSRFNGFRGNQRISGVFHLGILSGDLQWEDGWI